MKRSRDTENIPSGVIMHALVLAINQQNKFEVPSFTHSKDMIKAKN